MGLTPLWESRESFGEGNGNPLQYSCLENSIDGGAWWTAVHGVAKSRTRLNDFTFTFHFHALEKEMATHSSVLAWRISGTGDPGGLPSTGSHRVGHDWSDVAAAAAAAESFLSALHHVRIQEYCHRETSSKLWTNLLVPWSWTSQPLEVCVCVGGTSLLLKSPSLW